MQHPRKRLLSLRMTAEEYDRLRDASEGQGARSISDFARTVLLTLPADSPVSAAQCCCDKFSVINQFINRVENNLTRLLNGTQPDATA